MTNNRNRVQIEAGAVVAPPTTLRTRLPDAADEAVLESGMDPHAEYLVIGNSSDLRSGVGPASGRVAAGIDRRRMGSFIANV